MTLFPVLKVAVAFLLFAMGLSSSLGDVGYLFQRPWLLFKSLVAMYVLVPALAVLMATTLDIPRGTGAALVVLAVCAGAPLLPRRLMQADLDSDFVFSLVVTTSFLAILTVPISLRWLDRYLSFEAVGDPNAIARLIVVSFVAPLAVGMIVRGLAPAFAERIDDRLLRVAGLIVLGCTLGLLVEGRGLLLDLGWVSFGAFVVFAVGSLTVGHLLGGPTSIGRTSLALASGSRHAGLALLIAANARSTRPLTLLAGYLVATTLVSLAYLSYRRRRDTRGT